MNFQINFVLCGVVILFAFFALKGYKDGLVKGLVYVISMIVAIMAIGLIVSMVSSYLGKEFIALLIAVVFFLMLMLVSKMTKFLFVSFEFLSKLPVISWFNKLSGLCLGLGEAALFIWIAFVLLVIFGESEISGYVLEAVRENRFLLMMYENNYVVKFLLELG